MAAPVAVPRQAPVGLPLRDGFGTFVTFGDDPDLSIWELSTTPPGKDMGDGPDTSTFHNVNRRTKAPPVLVEDTDGSGTCGYDPDVESQLEAIIGVNMIITYTTNDGSTKAIWGYLKEFTPQEHSENEFPTANYTIVHTNTDLAFAEQAPVVVSVSGT